MTSSKKKNRKHLKPKKKTKLLLGEHMTYANVKARKIQEVQIRTGEGFSHKKALDFRRYRGYREENKKFTRPVHNRITSSPNDPSLPLEITTPLSREGSHKGSTEVSPARLSGAAPWTGHG